MEELAQLPLAVVVAVACEGDDCSCSTGTATYVAFEPALVATPFSPGSHTGQLARASGRFSLSVLAVDQADLAVRAASRSRDKVGAVARLAPPEGHGPPGVDGSVAVLWCVVESTLDLAGSSLVVGRIEHAHVRGGEPLVRHARRYRALGNVVDAAAGAAYPL